MSRPIVDFAREQLAAGRGEWWIVGEMVKRWEIDETKARAIVAAVSPGVYRRFLRRRRVYMALGAVIMALSTVPALWYGGFSRGPLLLGAMVALPGLAFIAYGWPGFRGVPRGDSPTSIPGRMKPEGPRLFRQYPFEWK